MVDWTSQASLDKQKSAIDKVDIALFGVTLWEWIVSLEFDIEIITRKRSFRLPTLLYFIARYGNIAFIISVLVFSVETSSSPNAPFSCQALDYLTNVASKAAMASASSLLMIRTIALWSRDQRVAIPLVILHLGQWAINLHNGFIVKETWSDIGDGKYACTSEAVPWAWVEAQFIYGMAFDFVVLVLACYSLMRHAGWSNLSRLLYLDGIFFFIISFAVYLPVAVVSVSGISVILTFIFSDIATVIVTIAACRSFVRIGTATFTPPDTSELPPVSTTLNFSREPWSATSGHGNRDLESGTRWDALELPRLGRGNTDDSTKQSIKVDPSPEPS